MFTLKRIISFLLTFILLFTLFPYTAYATGDPNIDGGGGGEFGSGTSDNKWSVGMEGVRITVVNAETELPVAAPFDMTSKSPTVSLHFGKVSKVQYRNGASLNATTGPYYYYQPAITMPQIISTNAGNANIEAIREYFCDEIIVRYIAAIVGMNYDILISGSYKILLEPVAYFVFNKVNVAMTAHEAAMYDNLLEGGLRSKMSALTHKNLPLAIFLEHDDLGFTAYTGSSTATQSNDTIIAYLGVGTIRFKDDDKVIKTDYDYEYRVNTDVITPVTLYAGDEINPDDPASVTFTINSSTYTVNNIVIPESESQLVWVKWRTPSSPQNMTISVSATDGTLSQTTINVKIVDLSGKDPPDPRATDTKGSWSPVSIPSRPQTNYAAWSIWYAEWFEFWEWEADWRWISN